MKSVPDELMSAEASIDKGDFDAALEIAQRVLQHDPDQEHALELVAFCAAQVGDGDLSEVSYKRLLTEYPHTPDRVLQMADVLVRQAHEDKAEQALQWLDEAESLAGDDAVFLTEVEVLRGLACSRMQAFEEAVAAFQRALEFSPDDGEAITQLGVAQFQLGRFAEARATLERAIDIDPGDAEALQTIGLLVERTDPQAAAEWFERAIECDDERYWTYHTFTREQFDVALKAAIEGLGDHMQEPFRTLTIDVQTLPSDADIKDGIAPTTTGVYREPPEGRPPSDSLMPPVGARLTLYQNNVQRMASSPDSLVTEIKLVLLYETSHFFGLDQSQMRDMGF